MARLSFAARVLTGLAMACALGASPVRAEDGHDLWLRYVPVSDEARAEALPLVQVLAPQGDSPTLRAATEELKLGLEGMLGRAPGRSGGSAVGTLIYGVASNPVIAALNLTTADLGDEGYLIRSLQIDGRPAMVITARTDIGVLYGAFALLRRLQTGQSLTGLDVVSRPGVRLRVLNHWDNLNRHVERGYSGQSIWDWHRLPGYRPGLYTDYARANASIGINGAVLNNVNADSLSLTPPYIEKAAALAEVFRPYGIRVYLSARFSAPIEIGGLASADPLDPQVAAWWKARTEEIYAAIPDFGGFLVKANSEGQPGPQDYRRTHADGANMLADAVAPHGGVVMWRAFVYAAENGTDRARQAYEEFAPLDGQFRENVILQVKNGPIDFQPREPFHPLFGAMPRTPLMLEVQITKEYLGFATHLAYLGPLYGEVLQSDTFRPGPGATVARVIDGSIDGHGLTGMAGVANIGADRNWSGSHFDQANWYAFGRMAWDPQKAHAAAVAEEWARMTFSNDAAFVEPVVRMMMGSREAVVDYMTPLGLHHLMATGHHYGPGPWVDDLPRPEWNPTYYHQADRDGIGFDRTTAGSNAISQYAPAVARRLADPSTTPETELLWFHHLSWEHQMRSGRTLWEDLAATYDRGVATVGGMQTTWSGLSAHVDPERFDEVAQMLAIQHDEARWWRDASLAYFSDVSGRPLPPGVAPPERSLADYKAMTFPLAPGN